MPVDYSQLPNALNWQPLNQGLNALSEGIYRNKQLEMERQNQRLRQQQATDESSRANERLGMQRTEFKQGQADRKAKTAAALAQSLLTSAPEQRDAMLEQIRRLDPEFDADLKAGGHNANDVEVWAPAVIARARGYQDPLEAQYKQAQIKELEGKADYYTNKATAPGGQSAPAGYRWTAEGNQEAIPGGPASKLPAETAGKVGMMQTAMQSIPTMRNIFLGEKHQETGKRAGSKISTLDYYLARGDTGEGWRLGTGAIESVLRAASGAAVPESEVERYSSLFLPTPYDTDETKGRKLDALERWIGNMMEAIQSGRPINAEEAARISQAKAAGQPQQRGPQPGAVEDGYRFKGGNPADPNSWEKVQ